MENNQKKQVENIRAQYAAKENTKLDELKKLDRKIKLPALIFTYTFGIIGALVLGLGMCLAMKVIGDMMFFGIIIGVVGIGMVSGNYFIYSAWLNSSKAKHADEIISMSNDILGE